MDFQEGVAGEEEGRYRGNYSEIAISLRVVGFYLQLCMASVGRREYVFYLS